MPASPDASHAPQPQAPESGAPAVPLAELLQQQEPVTELVREIGGRKDGPDPTRYGDWEKNGRCIDF